jgi:hypothetical protein
MENIKFLKLDLKADRVQEGEIEKIRAQSTKGIAKELISLAIWKICYVGAPIATLKTLYLGILPCIWT